MAGGGSKAAVYAAIGANSFVTVIKFVGFALTGSGAMLSEAIHSMADVGNQSLLALGMARAKKAADERHPYGYGLEAFIWALISAVGIFFVGCGFSIMHGIQALLDDHGSHIQIDAIAIGILVVSLIIEAGSLGVAVYGLSKDAKREGKSLVKYVRTTDDPFGVAVLFEDAAAVLGVLIALTAILLTQWTGNDVWDAIGTLAVGTLLGVVAVWLIQKNKGFLVGQSISAQDRAQLSSILSSDPAVQAVNAEKSIVRGSDTIRVHARLDLDGAYLARKWMQDRDLDALRESLGSTDALRQFLERYGEDLMQLTAAEVDRIESTIREAMPEAKNISLEPD
jgi:zinc transporter 9